MYIYIIGDLLGVVNEAKKKNEYLDEKVVMKYFTQLVLAVQYLHDNRILHRDIKISNIFLNKSGLLKLGDFGVAK